MFVLVVAAASEPVPCAEGSACVERELPAPPDPWTLTELTYIGATLFRAECGRKEVFQEFDGDADGLMSLDEFQACMDTCVPLCPCDVD